MTRRLFYRLRNNGSRSASRSRGFTLVELLVVITIIGILMSLLLPAVQNARARAQEVTCQNNLKNVGLAALSHEEHYGWFPTGGWPGTSGKQWPGDPNYGYGLNQPGGFFYNILPFIEQTNLWAYGQTGQTSTTLLQAAQMPVVVYNCPSRRPLGQLPMGSGVSFYSTNSTSSSTMTGLSNGAKLARCDYAACGGDADPSGGATAGGGPPTQPGPTSIANGQSATFWPSYASSSPPVNGICGPHSQMRGGSISRGRTCLFLVGEKYLDPDNYLNGLDTGDNATWDMGFDVNTVRWTGGGASSNSQYIPAQDTPGIPNSVSFGSTHVTGFNMCFADGSVHLLNFTIDPTMYGYLGNRTQTTDQYDLIDDSKW